MGVLGKGKVVHSYGEHLAPSAYDLTRGERKPIALRRGGIAAAAPVVTLSGVFVQRSSVQYARPFSACRIHVHTKFDYLPGNGKSCFYCRLYK